MQEKVYREFLKWIEDNKKYILILTSGDYKTKFCKNIGLMDDKGKLKYSLLNNKIQGLRNKIIELCHKHGIDIDSYLLKMHGQVNHKKSNHIRAKNLLIQIKGKPLLTCLDEIFNFYQEYKKQVPEVRCQYMYDNQQYCVYLELLDQIEFDYLPNVNKSVADRNYFIGLQKRDQILILSQMKNALVKIIKLYCRYDNKTIPKAA